MYGNIFGVRDCLTGYVVPGCVEDGTWMLWQNSSAAAAAAVVVVVVTVLA